MCHHFTVVEHWWISCAVSEQVEQDGTKARHSVYHCSLLLLLGGRVLRRWLEPYVDLVGKTTFHRRT